MSLDTAKGRALVARYRHMKHAIGGCSDGDCAIRSRPGMPAEGCYCLHDLDIIAAMRMADLVRLGHEQDAALTDALDAIDQLQANLDKMRREKRVMEQALLRTELESTS